MHREAFAVSRVTSTLIVLALLLSPPAARAGDLNAEVQNMFANLGTIGNYTAPGAFRGQMYNTYTGGSLFLRSPNKVYTLAAVAFPSAKAGCGGIDGATSRGWREFPGQGRARCDEGAQGRDGFVEAGREATDIAQGRQGRTHLAD